MNISRRDFLKGSAAAAAALGIGPLLFNGKQALAAEDGARVVWLQAQGCTGCSVSLLNSIYYTTIDDLLLNTLDLEYHPTVMAAAGEAAVSAAEAAYAQGGYVLVVEGAIPTAVGGEYCYLWPGMTALKGVRRFSENALVTIAVGTCASYGGMAGGSPNPTRAQGVADVVGHRPVINIPGCPAHPDWVVGTIAYILTHGAIPRLDNLRRPTDYFQHTVHSQCPNRQKFFDRNLFASTLSEEGCLSRLGCKGRWAVSDCPFRRWNSGGAGETGVNWCVGARSPCQGCTEPEFPDGMSPFFTLEEGKVKVSARGADGPAW
ncbi:MAG: hydrogenase small subunit [Armatimonadota bacterium]|nr:MAG: hydrogenase small subunit [Armatimonadota bacterium]